METQSLVNGLQWLGGGVVVLLGAIGAGSLILAVVNRRWATKDKRDDIHNTTQGKQIDADVAAFQIVADRLKVVEARLDKVQDDLTSQREMSAKKDATIERLERDNERLRDRCREQDKTIAGLRLELDELKLLVQKNGPNGSPTGTVEDPIYVDTPKHE